jgi:predicted DNA-binding transcriptional regulator AlpA
MGELCAAVSHITVVMAATFAAAAAAAKSSAGRSSTRAGRAIRDRFAAAMLVALVVSSAAASGAERCSTEGLSMAILNIQQLADKIGKSRRTVWRWVKKGWLPEPLYPNGWPVWDSEAVQKRLEKR